MNSTNLSRPPIYMAGSRRDRKQRGPNLDIGDTFVFVYLSEPLIRFRSTLAPDTTCDVALAARLDHFCQLDLLSYERYGYIAGGNIDEKVSEFLQSKVKDHRQQGDIFTSNEISKVITGLNEWYSRIAQSLMDQRNMLELPADFRKSQATDRSCPSYTTIWPLPSEAAELSHRWSTSNPQSRLVLQSYGITIGPVAPSFTLDDVLPEDTLTPRDYNEFYPMIICSEDGKVEFGCATLVGRESQELEDLRVRAEVNVGISLQGEGADLTTLVRGSTRERLAAATRYASLWVEAAKSEQIYPGHLWARILNPDPRRAGFS